MFKQQSKSKYVNIYINDCIRWSGGVNILTQIVNSLIDYDINFKILYVKESLLMKLLNRLRLTLRGGGYKNNKIIDESCKLCRVKPILYIFFIFNFFDEK